MGVADRAKRLAALNRAFYERTHDSFSSTRQSAWHGWEELWSSIGAALVAHDAASCEMRIADVACGNLRFIRFLQQKTKAPMTVYAFDECEPLLKEGLRALSAQDSSQCTVHETLCDIAGALCIGEDFLGPAGACDLTVAFGFMHHLATPEQRERLLRLMAAHTVDGGFFAVSFWRFADDDRMRSKAERTTGRAVQEGIVDALFAGDYVLGWQDDEEALRFCHSFTEEEIDALSISISDEASEVARFTADGKNGAMNRYAVWRRHG